MRRVAVVIPALIAVRSVAAITFYDNTPGAGETAFFSTSSPRTSGGDDIFFPAGSFPGLLTSMQFGYFVTGAPAFDAHVTFWGSLNVAAASGQPVFSDKLAEITVPLPASGFGTAISPTVDLTALPGGGVPVLDGDMGFQLDFRISGTATLVPNDAASYSFDGTGPNVGSSGDIYWRDLNANQQITGEEARNFGGGLGSLANFVLRLDGVTPEPSSGAIFAMSAMLIRRRRRDE